MPRAVRIGVLASVLWAGGLVWTASSAGRLADGLGRTHCHFAFEEDPARDCRKWGHRVFTPVDVEAPVGSRVRARLREDDIAFTNVSAEGRICRATLAGGTALDSRVWFAVPARQTHRIRYAAFRPGAGAAASTFGRHVFRSHARERLEVHCARP